VRLTPNLMAIIDALSTRVDQVIEERVAPMLKSLQEGTRKLYEAHPEMVAQAAKAGVTPEDIASRESDMPFFEGHSGLRSFIAQGLTRQIDEQMRIYGLVGLRKQLNETWFEHGKYEKLSPELKKVVRALATRERLPMTIYREVADILDVKVGDVLTIHQPRSWSIGEKAVMGETTMVARTLYGTHVSVLSRYVGEGEVIAYNPRGYVVERVEDRTFGGRRTRRIVHLRDN
jgi:hypothetical protein